jgi:plasmid stabilization system protein ParE
MIRVEWDKNAQDRHEAWALQIAIDFGLTSARTYLLDIESAQTRIAEFPLSGTDFESPGRPFLKRMVTATGYSVFYELDSPNHPILAYEAIGWTNGDFGLQNERSHA